MVYRRWRRQILLAVTAVFVVTVVTLSARLAPPKSSPVDSKDGASHESSLDSPSSPKPSTSKNQACPISPPQPAISPDSQGRFDWRTIQAKHPVESYTSLPTERPSSLPAVQHVFRKEPAKAREQRAARQEAVKEVFKRCWGSYRDLAWMKDELAPISGSSKNTFGGWGATLVDSLDTLWIMDMKDEFSDAVDAAVGIDFGPRGSDDVNMFETIIRYLGGFIAAYDVSDCKDARLLQKAIEVGDMAYASFDTPNRMPVTRWNPQKAVSGQQQLPAESGIIAEMASASVEFTRLSQLTGDMRYFDAISRISNVMDEQQSRTRLPGMWPVGVNVRAPDLTTGGQFSLGAMSDSAYEYLPKMYQLLGGAGEAAQQYRRMYDYAMTTVIDHSLFRPMVEDKADILVTSSVGADGRRDSSGQHLTCFAGGMLGLGGQITENETHVATGRKLTDGCIWTYEHAPLGIMPEVFSMYDCPDLSECDYTREPGASPFSNINDARYILRPEAIESVFYMYRITGDSTYQDKAWAMFEAIENNTSTRFGNAAIRDMTKSPPDLDDSMESFWMAETLKYFYLIFSEPDTISLDEWVFNTEAHPFRVPRP
ncbi:alpha-mannosidase IC [Pyrenophora tritici-repentis]|uniref:alpha-1,2-Mannosidase n=2 Tax=Pyrenophora tritici-repentis TaxID=45151 RepID=A0A2W1DGF1_9PLEO|nr:alpha-mannosidase IC [Pyrenophora tritici-repentis Pt-1C-BFP]KAA8619615.1 alpha-1 2-Mannosidase [Pyrenophora tritici-repentis]EDU47131.1 alpha-mannosidase IC [Pyrenophora tritici-repentis Pt-1C-BFP]KAF7447757.1 alpha-1-2-Mannosidase [Pyrenophora tritici-repentis]KAF7571453.1 Glyco-hydro-47 domain containing protein [Pyrenophora tritici-repentis]KAG9385314.1 alpha-1,2-Mannosidase [Pyrenophora tritici-repentis]